MGTSPPLRVLITDGDIRPALAATRSLGRLGHAVVVAGERRTCLAAVSRYAAGFVACPDPARQPAAFVEAIVSAAHAQAVDAVIPMSEITTLLLARHRSALPGTCRLPLAEAAVIDKASDKAAVIALARTLGVPIPWTAVCADAAEVRARTQGQQFPLVIKPARSRVEIGGEWCSTGVHYADNAAGLERLLAAARTETYPLLLQERIDGPGVGLFACYDHGRQVAVFAHRRLREKPPSGGVSVLRESIAADPQAVDHAHRLLGRLGWHGVAMVEFKRDQRDGSLRLMEINGRFWGSLQLAIDAGIDFPALLLDVALGRGPRPKAAYHTGVQSRWLLGDLDALLSVLFRRRSALHLPAGFPSRWRLLREFLRLRAPSMHYEVLTRDDPRPGLLELRRWLFGG